MIQKRLHQDRVLRPYGSPPTANGRPLFLEESYLSAWRCSRHILCPNRQGDSNFEIFRMKSREVDWVNILDDINDLDNLKHLHILILILPNPIF